ncbi:hypothetical protein [Marinitenerispora sediminis]|uniref:hypothetical protein n=1 Tax=Marinitenerispora sediminis TaxID=1931232 RepID=UPI000DF262DD|nr:hypothetical protein [Marinitenerispora sediminis]
MPPLDGSAPLAGLSASALSADDEPPRAVLDDTDAHIAALRAEVFRRAMQAGMVRSELAMLGRDAPEHGTLADVLHRLERSMAFLEGLITTCRLLQRSAGAPAPPARTAAAPAAPRPAALPAAVTRVAHRAEPGAVQSDPLPARRRPSSAPSLPAARNPTRPL